MKRTTLISILLLSSTFVAFSQNAKKTEYLNSFAKAYGYVKYFHPSDEAAIVDWNAFAIYGAEQILTCNSEEELVYTLKSLFEPIASSVDFINSNKPPRNNKEATLDESCEITYWQHYGLGKDAKSGGNLYKSSRVNSNTIMDQSSGFGNLISSISLDEYLNSEIKISVWAKLASGSKGDARLWFRVDNSDSSRGFFNNMGNNPIVANEWKQYEIIGTVGDKGSKAVFGTFLMGKGTAYVDGFEMSYRKSAKDPWTPIKLFNTSFEEDDIKAKNNDAINSWKGVGKGYNFTLNADEVREGNQSVQITYTGQMSIVKGEKLFDSAPERGATIEQMIGHSLYISVPLTMCLDQDKTTMIKADQALFAKLTEALENLEEDPKNLSTRVGNVVNAYNVFQHFYPYFDVIDIDWNNQLKKALSKSFSDTSDKDHLITLQQLTHALKDGHIRVGSSAAEHSHMPPFTWEIIEGKLVINQVFEDALGLKVGDVVTKVNGQNTSDYLKEVYSLISAGNQGWMDYRAKTESLLGAENSELNLVVTGKNVMAKRNLNISDNWHLVSPEKTSHKPINDDIYYINLSNTKMDTINKLMPILEQSKGLIFDLRGYPDGNHELISHLLKKNDTVQNWMQVPQILYPDQKDYAGFSEMGWHVQTKKPYLGDKKVVFLIDGSAISYAESYMGFIKGYKLATIVGQPTAGANGNVNRVTLPGNYSISFTGMKVLKHNGTQHHTIGVLPDVYIKKTISAMIENRDEFLEKAIQIIEQE